LVNRCGGGHGNGDQHGSAGAERFVLAGPGDIQPGRCESAALTSFGYEGMNVGLRMLLETKFLVLTKPVALGDVIEGWRVSWIGGWDKGRVVFTAMVERFPADPSVEAH
jgi:hypothetical protein